MIKKERKIIVESIYVLSYIKMLSFKRAAGRHKSIIMWIRSDGTLM